MTGRQGIWDSYKRDTLRQMRFARCGRRVSDVSRWVEISVLGCLEQNSKPHNVSTTSYFSPPNGVVKTHEFTYANSVGGSAAFEGLLRPVVKIHSHECLRVLYPIKRPPRCDTCTVLDQASIPSQYSASRYAPP